MNPPDTRPLIPAATVILVREGAGREIEVLLLQRNESLSFAGGMWVFAGGKCEAGEDSAATAVREANEEAGVRLAVEALRAFSHWTPPPESPSRYSTQFFVAPWPDPSENVTVDGSEIVAFRWMRPAEALDACVNRELRLSPPTVISLYQLAALCRLDDQPSAPLSARLENLLSAHVVESFATSIVSDEDRVFALYHGDAEYPGDGDGAKTGVHRLEFSTMTYIRDLPVDARGRISTLVRRGSRQIGVDIVGTRGGRDVIYTHGTPDSRRSRHPDDSIAARVGVRLLAIDRPGIGLTDRAPLDVETPSDGSHADAMLNRAVLDVAWVLEALGSGPASVLGWSVGSIVAWACGELDAVDHVVLAAPLAPASAWSDTAIAATLSPARAQMAELIDDLGVEGGTAVLAPYLVPEGLDLPLAIEIVREDPARAAVLDSVPGADERLALGCIDSVRNGSPGLADELTLQFATPPSVPSGIRITVVHGTDDVDTPIPMADWYAARARSTRNPLTRRSMAGTHLFPLVHWEELLSLCADPPSST